MNTLPVELIQYVASYCDAVDRTMLSHASHLFTGLDVCKKSDLLTMAASTGNILTVKYALSINCPHDINTLYAAASSCNLECLQTVHNLGYQFDVKTFKLVCRGNQYATYGGCYQVVKYLHTNQCPYSPSVFASAHAFYHHINQEQFDVESFGQIR